MDIKNDSQNLREKFVLAVYGVYTVGMVIACLCLHWESWIVPVIIAGLVIAIAIKARDYKDYKFRSLFTTCMMWMNFLLYIRNAPDFTMAFTTFAAITILLAIYCNLEYTYIGVVIYTVLLIYHFALKRDLTIAPDETGFHNILCIVSLYVVQYVTYVLIRTQKQSNSMMEDNMKAVREAERSKDDFMSNMSHEIRTPINTVCGISEMVLRENLTEEARQGVYDIQTAGRHLLSLVSDILDFTELASGKMEIIPDTYNITSTLNDILNMAVAKADGKNIELIVDCDAQMPSGLVGDEQKIRRAITNVVDNAIKFTDEGGVIISLTTRKESYGVNLVVTVRDTGIGIKEADLETLFTRFSMVDTKRNRQEGGMGLGLSISKVIVNKMGGFISAKSKYGEGTEVQLVFPQKVDTEVPVVALDHPEKCSTVLYLNTDKYNSAVVRDGYTSTIRHIVAQLGMYYRHARSLAELRTFIEREEFTHIFISWEEYCEDRDFFEQLSHTRKVVLILDRGHKEGVMGSKLLVVYKPFYVLTIASVLNGRYAEHLGRDASRFARFTAPSASVLVVDDNLMNLKVVEGLLRPYKIKVFIAQSGKEALTKLETERFDIIFMDHMMPEMDGIECFHRIRSKHGSFYQNVPIVALTANAIGGAREMFLSEGFTDYVAKPIELSALERVLYKYIPDEKLEKLTDEEAEAAPLYDDSDDRDSQGIEIEGIDVNVGIGYCGGRLADYVDVISAYYHIGASKAADIRRAFSAQDWREYTTLVHAVKSTSFGIGAKALGDMARELEAAGRNEDAEFITGHNDAMLDEYERILRAIGQTKAIFPDGVSEDVEPVPSDDGSLEEIGTYALLEDLDKLSWLMDSFETEAISAALDELYKYSYKGEALRRLLADISKMIDNFDFISAKDALDSLKEDMR